MGLEYVEGKNGEAVQVIMDQRRGQETDKQDANGEGLEGGKGDSELALMLEPATASGLILMTPTAGISAPTRLVGGESTLPESASSLTIPVDVVMGTETSGLTPGNVELALTVSVGDESKSPKSPSLLALPADVVVPTDVEMEEDTTVLALPNPESVLITDLKCHGTFPLPSQSPVITTEVSSIDMEMEALGSVPMNVDLALNHSQLALINIKLVLTSLPSVPTLPVLVLSDVLLGPGEVSTQQPHMVIVSPIPEQSQERPPPSIPLPSPLSNPSCLQESPLEPSPAHLAVDKREPSPSPSPQHQSWSC